MSRRSPSSPAPTTRRSARSGRTASSGIRGWYDGANAGAHAWRMLDSMASKGLEQEIERLYQLPLEEFTPARNALAKGSTEAARIRALAKPPIGAWAVNQLYWTDPDTWNA